jgi:spore coat protein CotH
VDTGPITADVPEIDPDPADDIAFIYDQEVLRTFELVLTEENMEILDSDPAAENYVSGTLIYDGVAYDNVGVRYKGSAGAWINCVAGSTPQNLWNFTGAKTCDKLNLKVSFNEYDSEGRFFAVKKLLFHAMNSDRSLMRERLGYGVFRQMGVAAPRVVHARLFINGELSGLYANVEYIDGRFTRSRFEDGKGNLYKEVWPAYNELTGVLTEARLLAGLRTNEDENPSVEKPLAFSAAMAGSSDDRSATLSSWMSVPYLASFIAADRGIGADDGPFHYYCSAQGCSNHNFYFYEEEKDERLWLIPWDLDNAFVVLDETYKEPADQFLRVMSDWYDLTVPCEAHPGSVEWTPWQMPPACDPIFRTTAEHFFDAYEAAVGTLLDGPFSEEVVAEQLEAWTAQILDTVVEVNDLQPTQISPSGWYDGLNNLKGRIEVLRERAASSVEAL